MNATRLNQIEEIYQAAADRPLADKNEFIKARCGGDDELRRQVESLLTYENISASFLDSSPGAIAAEVFAEDDDPDLVGTTVGHYRIEGILGEGGMGKVYLADDTLLSRKVALKILPTTLFEHPDRLKRFKQEAKAASALNHPNILTIHEFGTEKDTNYIVTEFVDGVTLRQKMTGRLMIREMLEIAVQAASALAAAHAAGIVHRDVKPDNIMIRRDGILKVLDFGLAKLSMTADPSGRTEAATMFKTEPGVVMGTPHYMSPEQARGLKLDPRTDIWGLGVIIYEMATGELPFTGPTQTDILVAILNQPVPMTEKFIDDAPAELKRIIEKALAKNADDRYRSMEELASDLKRFHHRLELESEREMPESDAHTTDRQSKALATAAQVKPVVSTRTLRQPGAAEVPNRPASENMRAYTLGAAVVLLTIAAVAGGVLWRSLGPGTANEQQAVQVPLPPKPVPVPSRSLTYSLTVQSFTDGRYKEPFTLSGEMLFRNRDRIRLNISSPYTGYLYILNQGPRDENSSAAYNILFPSPTTNEGTAMLSAGQIIQIPKQSWFELDEKEGTELVWLIWSAKGVPELESAKRFANPNDRGRIKDAGLINSIESLIEQQAKPTIVRDDDRKESVITANADIVAHLIKLEHH